MSFAHLSGAAVLLGALALAAALFALQRLRVRQREVAVVTTLFWRQALEESRARVFVERFRHPLAWLLSLALALALWFALAGARVGSDPARSVVLLLDTSAGMARVTADGRARLDHALDALRARLADEPAGVTRVVAVGAEALTLLAPGEPRALLDRRCAGLAPEAAPAGLDRALLDLAAALERADVLLFGDAPVTPEVVEACAPGLSVRRADLGDGPSPGRGWVALGVGEARSAAWDRVDVLGRVAGGTEDTQVVASLDGAPLASEPARQVGPAGLELTWRDVPAAGARFEVALAGEDELALDDRAALVLPRRARVRVEVDPELRALLADWLDADPALEVVADGGAVCIVRAGDPRAAGRPALVVDEAQDEAAFRLAAPAGDGATLAELVRRLALERIDAQQLATELERPLLVELADADARRLTLWSAQLDERYSLSRSRALPLLLGATVRWLADVAPLRRSVAAGSPLADPFESAREAGPWTAADGASLDAVGAGPVPASAGVLEGPRGPLVASLLDLATSAPERVTAATLDEPGAPARGARDATVLLALLALALLAVDAVLHARGRIP